MSYDLDNVKTTIKEHPAETVAAVAVVTLVGTIFYYKRKQKKAEIRVAQLQAQQPPWWTHFIGRRRSENQYHLKLVA